MPSRGRLTRFAAASTLALALAGAAASASAAVPRRFVGVNVGTSLAALADPGREFRVMARAGIGSVRIPVDWAALQPWPDASAVPDSERAALRDAAGVPTDFRGTDRLVEAAASAGIEVMVTVVHAPGWARAFPSRAGSPPRGTARFADVLRALVGRYGPRGSFWREHPGVVRRAVRTWQLWNEPDIPLFWDGARRAGRLDGRWARQYAPLARAGAAAIRAEDRRARILLAGLTNRSWEHLGALLSSDPGLARLVDAAAVHPYTARPANVVAILRLARAVLRAHRAGRVPVVVSEWGWPSAAGHRLPRLGFEVTRAQQAARAAGTLRSLAALRTRLGVSAAYWFDWASPDDDTAGSAREYGAAVFAYSGLRRLRGQGPTVPKPAFAAFARTAMALEAGRP